MSFSSQRPPAYALFDRPREVLGFRQMEISGPVCSTLAVAFAVRVLAADARPAAWIVREKTVPFPVDLRDAGAAPERIVLVLAGDDAVADKAADTILRSGQFSLLIVDLLGDHLPEPGVASRFMHLCRRYRSTMVYVSPRHDLPTFATAAVHLTGEAVYGETEQRIRIGVRRSRHPLSDCEIPAYGPDYLY